MTDIQLSKNFMLSEFTASETARRFKINNDASESSENIQDSDNLTNTHTIPRCFGCKNQGRMIIKTYQKP